MPKVTVSIPKELKERLDAYPQVNWTAVLRSGLKEKVSRLKKLEASEGKPW